MAGAQRVAAASQQRWRRIPRGLSARAGNRQTNGFAFCNAGRCGYPFLIHVSQLMPGGAMGMA